MPVILPWQPNETSDAVLRHLAAGGCALLPTESTYELVASALSPEGAGRLANVEGQTAIVVPENARLRAWLPLLSGAGERLLRKLGTGPLIMHADAGFAFGLWSRLPEPARSLVVREGQLAIHRPAHPLLVELARADVPLISVATEIEAVSAEALDRLGDAVACVVDAGPTSSAKRPSIVRTAGRSCRLQHEGSLAREVFEALTTCRILFVCTGNTCRSPMAAGLCARLLADQLGCTADELQRFGFCVQSAGLAALTGAPASPDAIRVAAEFGADIAAHRSGMITLDTLVTADHIFAMTFGHWHTIAHIPVAEMPPPRMLSPQQEDVPDPIGGELSDYRMCAEQIMTCLRQRLPELLES